MALALFALTLLLFWPGLGGPFVFDDFPALVSNARVHAQDLAPATLWKSAFSFDPGGLGRPLAMLTFAINHALGGLDPWGYKLGGLIVHAFNALLVFVLVAQVLVCLGTRQSNSRWAAFAVSLAWAIHPLQVSTVLYVVQRMETLSLLFVLLALISYVHGRRRQIRGQAGWPWLLACLPLLLLGLSAKETAALFPAYTLALELTVLGFRAASPRTSRRWRWAYGISIMLAVVVFMAWVLPRYSSPDPYASRNFNTVERLMTQLRVLPLYLGQIVWPTPGQMPFYYDDVLPSRSLLEPVTTLCGAVFMTALLAAGWLLRARAPLAALGIMWFFAAHVITSNVIPLELVFEHRNYFALLGVLFVLTDIIQRLPVRDGPAIKYAGVVVLLVGLGVLTLLRSATWGDRLLLATDLAGNNPRSERAAHELGVTYYEMADGNTESPFYSFAINQFEREAAMPGSSILGDQALILMRASAGLPVPADAWLNVHRKLANNVITPATTHALFALLENRYKGVELDDQALSDAFVLMFDRVRLPPQSHAQAGDHALRYLGDAARAERLFRQAVASSTEDPAYVSRILDNLEKEGQPALVDAVRDEARRQGIPVPAAL
ncbi:hypothetical protein [Marilutibacter aestuarii]|uniref:Tetratricopeptide repeat protein n=1 Tax=Marilutibacter aestuarii TaxID=1706195 RepID=A0A508AL77_9GAMM|nr:hypothetical protein [Lysobacter aestuarii]TQD49663.1 hypothetical protein FKV25_04235 [Lysobacter aestuarii]